MSVISNTMKRRISTRTVFADAKPLISSAISWNQGDLLYLDTTNHLIKAMTVETQSATFLGIAPVKITSGKYPAAYLSDVDASVGIPSIPGPEYGSVYQLRLKAGDAIVPGQKVYMDTTSYTDIGAAQGVTVTVGTQPVGVYQGKALTAATGGTDIEVLIGQQYQVGV
jgi:hypothetical protein